MKTRNTTATERTKTNANTVLYTLCLVERFGRKRSAYATSTENKDTCRTSVKFARLCAPMPNIVSNTHIVIPQAGKHIHHGVCLALLLA